MYFIGFSLLVDINIYIGIFYIQFRRPNEYYFIIEYCKYKSLVNPQGTLFYSPSFSLFHTPFVRDTCSLIVATFLKSETIVIRGCKNVSLEYRQMLFSTVLVKYVVKCWSRFRGRGVPKGRVVRDRFPSPSAPRHRGIARSTWLPTILPLPIYIQLSNRSINF